MNTTGEIWRLIADGSGGFQRVDRSGAATTVAAASTGDGGGSAVPGFTSLRELLEESRPLQTPRPTPETSRPDES